MQVRSLREERETVQSVLDIGRRLSLDGWVLYPTRDETVAAIARNRPELASVFRVPTPAWETVRWIWDKRNTYCLASRLGIPTPQTWYPQCVADLKDITAPPPFAVKPAIKEHFFYATKAKAWRANSHAQLGELYVKASQQAGQGEIMIQDLIPGDGRHQYAYCAFFKDGNAAGSMVVRRTRQHPPEFGRASTFVETIDLPELEALSEKFLRAIDYYGLVELEYKLDPRDGQFKLLDVNGRTWGYHTLGCRAGVDFSYLEYADQGGEAMAPCKARAGVSWIRLVTDVPTSVLEIIGGRQDWRTYVRSLRDCSVESVASREDPLPAIAEFAFIPYLSAKRGL